MERKIKKGDIYYANLSGTVGSEQSGTRPVLIVQNDIGNKYSTTVIIVPLTKKIRRKINQPTHYWIRLFGKIKFDSIILAEQIRVIDKRRLREQIGFLDYKTMQEIDKKIKIALDIK